MFHEFQIWAPLIVSLFQCSIFNPCEFRRAYVVVYVVFLTH